MTPRFWIAFIAIFIFLLGYLILLHYKINAIQLDCEDLYETKKDIQIYDQS